MHIPDGCLSPSTCAALYAGTAPFWWIALKRVEKLLRTRLVPLLSLFAAFCFVIMMFNVPLFGGTTGHATGIAITTVVLGPWAAIIAMSVALAIQAFFFQDGGITALAANCFNIAVLGAFTTQGVYRLLAGNAPLRSSRRALAAGAAGYAAINVAALATAVEVGIQPLLFKDAGGAPLYFPFPLSVAVPMMMIGHLTVFGLAETFVTAGLVRYLQSSDAQLLAFNAPGARDEKAVTNLRPLWTGLALLMILTPLGLLAAGTAWGEWGAEEFGDEKARLEIAQQAMGHPLPTAAPPGWHKLSQIWSAPLPDYAPPFLRNESFGYILSAMLGSGLVIGACLLLGSVTRRRPANLSSGDP
jgi:cobalt/nickel transport system permease protein